MDFTDIINLLSSYTPEKIADIDSAYLAGIAIAIIILLWIIVKIRKKPHQKELIDIISANEQADEEGAVDDVLTDESEPLAQSEDTLEEIQEPSIEDDSFVQESGATTQEVEDESATIEKPTDIKMASHKKRESQRSGRKINKSDFADFRGKRLLVAEDNLINQKVLSGVLNDSGIDVVMADDGQIVLDILEKDNDFEIILMDAHMPRIDGFEATRRIRENENYDHTAIIALSGDTAADDIRKMHEAGMEEHLEKPLKMDALYDVLSMYYTMPEIQEDVLEKPYHDEVEAITDISELASLDYDQGLDICGGDEKMYRQLLKEFFIEYKDSSKKLHTILVDKDYEKAKALLVDVKGTASNVGAKQFIYVTENFIKALSKDEKEAYADLFKDYQAYLLVLLKSIQNAFKV